MSINKEFLNLYTNSVHDYCNKQSSLLKFIESYMNLKEGTLSEEDIVNLYIEHAEDDEWSFTQEEEHGSKRNYVEYKLLDLIQRYRVLVNKELEVSFKRLDVLLGVLNK